MDLPARLIQLGARADHPDAKGRTPFLNFYGIATTAPGDPSKAWAERLLGLGANVNAMDASGLFALKYAVIRREGPEIASLVGQHGADINQVDGHGRNLLHHAINMSSATADATFDIERQLIGLGIELNRRDKHSRTPLHYAFVKIGRWQDSSASDPIEAVSSLCGYASLEIDVPDRWQKTPLHHASQRGASICAMYLQKRGADLEAVDIYGNAPLAVALHYKHFNYGIILIQKAEVSKLVYPVDPRLLEKANKEPAGDSDEEMQDVSEPKRRDKRHRHLFDR